MNQLDLYNDALLLLGQRQLASLSEDREPRYRLDGAYGRDAIRYCLELVKPSFASSTAVLSAFTPGATFDNSFTLPSDYVSVIKPFSDKKLDQEINRYIIEKDQLLCDYTTVYLRYTSDNITIDDWSPSFFRVVGAYLARETATRLSPDDYVIVEKKFQERVAAAQALEKDKVPVPRSSDVAVTLTDSWRLIYNDSLLIMGLDEITSNDDDSNRRTKLDRALNAGIVAGTLEDMSWQFGFTSVELTYDSGVEPAFGWLYAIRKPADLQRIDGLYTDEYQKVPLKDYGDEGSFFFCSYQVIYLSYISTNFLANPNAWPTFFRRLIAARMAKDAAPSLRVEGADAERADMIFEERESDAKSNSAMQSPPRLLATGKWVRSRNWDRGNRNWQA
jgi:hypothetical protein